MFKKNRQESALQLHARITEENRRAEQQTEDNLKYVRGADGQPISVQDAAAIERNIRNTRN